MSDTTTAPDIQSILEGEEFGLSQMQAICVAVYDSNQAVSSLQEALEALDPSQARGEAATSLHLRRGYLLLLLGRHEEAAAELRSASDKEFGVWLLGRCLIELGARGEALEVLADGLKAHSRSVSLAVALTEALLLTGDLSAGRKRLDGLENKGASAADVAYLQGLLAELEGNYAEGLAAYERAVAEQDDHARALFRLGYHHATHGDEDEAISYYERCQDLTPNHGNALLNLGNLYEDRGDYEKASEAYERVLRVIPNHSRARMFLKDARSSKHMFYDEDIERRADRRNQILKIPVTDFELSVRSRNCLNKMNIKCLGDLVQKTETELLSYKNFGETSLQEIKQMLAQKSLRLGMGRPDQPGFFDSVGASGPEDEEVSVEIGEDVLNKPLGELNLSVRSSKVMEKLGIRTVGELCRRGESELLSAKNFGQTSLAEIRQKLSELGVSLSASPASGPSALSESSIL